MEKKVAEGAEADIFAGEVAGIPAIIKDRIKKDYRAEQLDTAIRSQRTKSEAKITAHAKMAGVNVPTLLLVSGNRLYASRIDGETLNHLMLAKKESQFTGAIEDAAGQLALIHSKDLVHGDYTPANLMLDKQNRLWVIDFGLGEFTNSVEEKALDVLLMKRSISPSLYKKFEHAYLYSDWKYTKHVIAKLAEIERRGRYQTRTLMTG